MNIEKIVFGTNSGRVLGFQYYRFESKQRAYFLLLAAGRFNRISSF